jgi:hypothetical protein
VLERLLSIQAPICVASQGPPEKMLTTLAASRLAPFFLRPERSSRSCLFSADTSLRRVRASPVSPPCFQLPFRSPLGAPGLLPP